MQLPELIIILITIRNILITFRCIVKFLRRLLFVCIKCRFECRLSVGLFIWNCCICSREMEVEEYELLSPQIIFIFIEGSPVNKSVKYQNRGTNTILILQGSWFQAISGKSTGSAMADHEHFNFILHIVIFPCLSLIFLDFIAFSRHLTQWSYPSIKSHILPYLGK